MTDFSARSYFNKIILTTSSLYVGMEKQPLFEKNIFYLSIINYLSILPSICQKEHFKKLANMEFNINTGKRRKKVF